MEARLKLSAPAVPGGQVVEVREIGEDGRPGAILSTLANGESLVFPVGKEGYDLVLRIRGV